MKNTATTLQGIYNSELLPEILGLCQHFFSALIKRACHNSLPALNSTDQDIANINAIVQLKLKKALYLHALKTLPEVFTDSFALAPNTRIEDLVAELSRNLSAVTQVNIPHTSNPLAPAPILTFIEQSLNINYGYQPAALQADIEQQFLLLARGFYKKINTLFIPYLPKQSSADSTTEYPELIVDAEFYLTCNTQPELELSTTAEPEIDKTPKKVTPPTQKDLAVAATITPPVTQLDNAGSADSIIITPPDNDLQTIDPTHSQLPADDLQTHPVKTHEATTTNNNNSNNSNNSNSNSGSGSGTNSGTKGSVRPTFDQSKAAIEHTKYFFDHELGAEKIGSHFHALCKRIYIAAINYSLITPDAFSKTSKSPFKQVLLQIKAIGIHCHLDALSEVNIALASATEAAINQLIKNTLEGDINLQRTSTTLASLIKQYTASAEAVVTPINPKAAARPLANSHTQAKHIIDTIMNDNAPSHSVAADLKQDWIRVLKVIGNTHGVHSAPWGQAVENFIDLLAFKNHNPLPATLAHAVQEQLKLAGLSTVLRTQMPPLKIVAHTSDNKEAAREKALEQEKAQEKEKATEVTAAVIKSLQEGMWFDYNDGEVTLRCKLAAIIRQIKRYIFISRQGEKVLELHYDELQKMLMNNELSLCLNVSLNSSLEDVLTNIKNTHAPESA